MRKKIIIGIIIVFVLMAGYFVYSKKVKLKNEINTQTESFTEFKLTKQNITESLSTTGIIQSKEESHVYSKINGMIENILVEENELVKKGDIVAIIDSSDLTIQIKQQENTIINIENELNDLKNNGNINLINEYENKKNSYENTKEIYERNKTLFNSDAISQIELDASHLNYETMKNELNVIESNLRNSSLNQDILLLERRVDVEKNILENLKIDLENTEIKSPIDGVVIELAMENGQLINNGNIIFTVINTDKLEITTSISEFEINKIKKGQNVIFNTLSDEQLIYNGAVSKIASVAESNGDVSTIEALIDVTDKNTHITPNITVNLTIKINEKNDAFVVPYSALITRKKGKFIRTSDDVFIKVKTGIESDMNIEIISDELKEGMIIKVKETISLPNYDKSGDMKPGIGAIKRIKGD